MLFGFFLHYIVNTRAKTSVVQSLAVGKLTSGFPNRVLNMSLCHMKMVDGAHGGRNTGGGVLDCCSRPVYNGVLNGQMS